MQMFADLLNFNKKYTKFGKKNISKNFEDLCFTKELENSLLNSDYIIQRYSRNQNIYIKYPNHSIIIIHPPNNF